MTWNYMNIRPGAGIPDTAMLQENRSLNIGGVDPWRQLNTIYRNIIRQNEQGMKEEPKKKEYGPPIHNSKYSFMFGNCAAIAICSAFNIEYKALRIICFLLKMNVRAGLSFFECKKLINLLGEQYDKRVQYFPNTSKMRYDQLLLAANEDTFLVMFDEHVSYAEKGEIYDSFYFNSDKINWENYIPTGWWRIK